MHAALNKAYSREFTYSSTSLMNYTFASSQVPFILCFPSVVLYCQRHSLDTLWSFLLTMYLHYGLDRVTSLFKGCHKPTFMCCLCCLSSDWLAPLEFHFCLSAIVGTAPIKVSSLDSAGCSFVYLPWTLTWKIFSCWLPVPFFLFLKRMIHIFSFTVHNTESKLQ